MDRFRAILDLRVDLMVAVLQFTTVIHIRRSNAEHCSAERNWIAIVVERAVIERRIRRRRCDRPAEIAEEWVVHRAGRTAQRSKFLTGQNPDANAITISWVICAARMETSGFAAIFNVDAEQHATRLAAAFVTGVIAHAGERDLVGWSFARLRAEAVLLVVRVAEFTHDSAGIGTLTEAGAHQTVKALGVEVGAAAALGMSDVFPIALDALTVRIEFAGTPNRRPNLTTMSHIANREITHAIDAPALQREDQRTTPAIGILPAAASDAATGRGRAPHDGFASIRSRN